jgi:hypothetical protein
VPKRPCLDPSIRVSRSHHQLDVTHFANQPFYGVLDNLILFIIYPSDYALSKTVKLSVGTYQFKQDGALTAGVSGHAG